ncbi:MAG: tyrosine-type recombinase/integrase [Desulfobacterales bacterium]|nr:tyrosine-type recombinase/integrase [Desulfobacterales bacterium]
MLAKRQKDNKAEYVFLSKKKRKIKEVSSTFDRAVEITGLNKGVSDPREKVVFHTLRHTFASWLVEKGEDLLYTVKKLMGHSALGMTERYSHLGDNTLQNAVKKLDAITLNNS